VDKVAERWKVRLVDLNKDEFIQVTPPNPLSLKKLRVAKTEQKMHHLLETVKRRGLKSPRKRKTTLLGYIEP
jgi:hypothetical protein